jgi:hypothetical protein
MGKLRGGDVLQGGKELVVVAARENAAPLPHLTSALPQDHASAGRTMAAEARSGSGG